MCVCVSMKVFCVCMDVHECVLSVVCDFCKYNMCNGYNYCGMQLLRNTADELEYCMTLDPDRLQVIIEKGNHNYLKMRCSVF